MKNLIDFLSMFMIFSTSFFCSDTYAQTDADNILGKWKNGENNRVLEFIKNGQAYDAVIREAADKTFVGKRQIAGLKYENGIYRGNVYLLKRARVLPCEIIVTSNGNIQLFVKQGSVHRSQTLIRVR
jgi:uncharacterized protein (DUF2147 family)